MECEPNRPRDRFDVRIHTNEKHYDLFVCGKEIFNTKKKSFLSRSTRTRNIFSSFLFYPVNGNLCTQTCLKNNSKWISLKYV